MGKLEQQLSNVRLGSHCWCVLKTTIVDATKTEKPEFLIHLTRGYVASKGIQQNDDGTVTAFVEIAGQRIKASHVFESPEDASDKLEAMMQEIVDGIAASKEGGQKGVPLQP